MATPSLIQVIKGNQTVDVPPSEWGEVEPIVKAGIQKNIFDGKEFILKNIGSTRTNNISIPGRFDSQPVSISISSGINPNLLNIDRDVTAGSKMLQKVRKLANDLAALELIYESGEPFAALITMPDIRFFLPFMVLDDFSTDVMRQALLKAFDTIWGPQKGSEEYKTRASLIDMALTIGKLQPYDLRKLYIKDSNGKRVQLSGTLYPWGTIKP